MPEGKGLDTPRRTPGTQPRSQLPCHTEVGRTTSNHARIGATTMM